MNKLILTAGAKLDLAEIKACITGRLKNASPALRIAASITKELHTLERFPQMGRVIELEEIKAGYRALVCGNYLAVYRIAGDTVYVDRILYGRRDDMALLFGADLDQKEEPEGES